MNRKRLVTPNLPMMRLWWLSLSVAELAEALFVSPSFALMQKKQKIKAEKPVTMGAPWACRPRGTTPTNPTLSFTLCYVLFFYLFFL
jgi:hypothetical protein